MASEKGWRANHRHVWARYEARRVNVLSAQLNARHLAIAKLAEVLQAHTQEEVRIDVIHTKRGQPARTGWQHQRDLLARQFVHTPLYSLPSAWCIC